MYRSSVLKLIEYFYYPFHEIHCNWRSPMSQVEEGLAHLLRSECAIWDWVDLTIFKNSD